MDAYNFFISGLVDALKYHKQNDNFVFMADVKPSYRVNENPHKPWVAIKMNGSVTCAHCNCMARWVNQSRPARFTHFIFKN